METGVGPRAGAGHGPVSVALPSFAADEDAADETLPNGVSVVNPGGPTEGVTGMEMSKTLQLNADGKTGILTLEAYATGQSQVLQKEVPWTSSWSWTSPALWRISLTAKNWAGVTRIQIDASMP